MPPMRQIRRSQITAAVILALSLAGAARAQEKQTPGAGDESAPKAEAGAQYSKIRFGDAEPSPAFAGFVTYNLTGHLAVDASAYFFPFKLSEDYLVGGRPFQLQAGIRAGKRFRRFGLFAKARPGFVTFGETVTPKLGQSFIGVDGRPFFPIDFITERKTHFSLDLGGGEAADRPTDLQHTGICVGRSSPAGPNRDGWRAVYWWRGCRQRLPASAEAHRGTIPRQSLR